MNIRVVLILAPLGLTLAACSHAVTGTVAAASKPSAASPAAASDSSIVVTKAAQSEGGIRVESAAVSGLPAKVSANGQVVPDDDHTWHVGAFISGRISDMYVNLGDDVKPGQELLRIHSHDIHDVRANFLQAREALRQAQDRAGYAQRARDRAQRLLALQAISREQADQAETEYRSAEAQVTSAKAGVERERVHLVDVLEVPLDANGDPSDTDTAPIRAPQAGTVIERLATVGAVAPEGGPLVTISDLRSLWVVANVNECDLPALRVGQKVGIEVRAWPERTFSGRILKLGESLDPATRTLQVRVQVPNPAGLLKPQMFATVLIDGGTARSALTVPRDAMQDVNGHSAVFVQTGEESFEARTVKAGENTAGRIEIAEGLKPGDRVVVQGSFGLKSAMLKSLLKED